MTEKSHKSDLPLERGKRITATSEICQLKAFDRVMSAGDGIEREMDGGRRAGAEFGAKNVIVYLFDARDFGGKFVGRMDEGAHPTKLWGRNADFGEKKRKWSWIG
jgi:hypothetical protein